MSSLTDSQGLDLAGFNEIDTPDDVDYSDPFIQTPQNKSKQLMNKSESMENYNKSVTPTKQDE